MLTHWGQITHICICNLTLIGSDNGLWPGRHQVIIWTNAIILLIGPLKTHFSEILIEIRTFSLEKMHLKRLSAKWQPFCLGLRVVITVTSYETSLREAVPSHAGPLSGPLFKQWNLLLSLSKKRLQTAVTIPSGHAIRGDRNLRSAAT